MFDDDDDYSCGDDADDYYPCLMTMMPMMITMLIMVMTIMMVGIQP